MNDPQPEGHLASYIARRKFLASLLGGAATWPLAAGAQQPAMPLVGFLGTSSLDADGLRAFHLGLKEAGYVEGDNVTILHRWTEGRLDQLPEAAADLARRRVAVIASFGMPAALAAKRLELLLELMPGAKNLAVLVDPAVPPTQTTLREVTAAASTMGLRIKILNASNSSEINAAFATLARERPDVLFVGLGFLFIDRRVQLVHLATLHKLPTTYAHRQFPEIGGLMS